ncbi:MAG: hypothetical protein NUV77_09680, partial [Thermoguttaceae bacterium]|nr:hypothetical protein [Thermoguttaceae bacterium]
MVDDVVLEHMVVAADADGLVRGVVDQIVRGPVAHAFQQHGVGVGQLVAREPPDVVVDGLVPRGRKRSAVAAGKDDPAGSRVVNVAALDAVAETTVDGHAELADVPHATGENAVGRAPADLDPVALRCLNHQSAKDHVRCLAQR